MNYQFPIILNISDVLPAIEGRDEFVVVEKDGGYTVINYIVAFDDSFPEVNTVNDAIRRECRGIIFDTETGNILHRRFHKFFNSGEKPETQLDKIDLTKPHKILKKLDGSMISPLAIGGKFRFGTKMGVTDVALPVETHVIDHPEIISICQECFDHGMTPLFEWCSRQQKIVIDYPEDELVLLAVRDNVTGKYMLYDDMVVLANLHDVKYVEQYEGTVENMQQLVNSIREETGVEGYIIRFDDGHMVKIKCDEYVSLHRAKDGIRFEKNVISIIVNEQLDDLKPFLQGIDLERVIDFEHRFWQGVESTSKMLVNLYSDGVSRYPERKDFATNFAAKQDARYRPFLFNLYDGKEILKCIVDALSKSTSSQTLVDKSRWLFNNEKWIESKSE